MLEILLANKPATLAALFAVTCQILWPFCASRSLIIVLQFGTNGGFTAHYGLLGLWAASAVSAIAATQACFALYAPHNSMVQLLGYLLIPAMIVTGYLFWDGPLTLLSVAAMVLISLGRMQTSDRPLRVLLMCGAGFWAVHDLIIASYLAFAANVLTIIFSIWYMARGHSPAT